VIASNYNGVLNEEKLAEHVFIANRRTPEQYYTHDKSQPSSFTRLKVDSYVAQTQTPERKLSGNSQ